MNAISWLISRIIQYFFSEADQRKSRSLAADETIGSYTERTLRKPRNFDADYRDAVTILKTRMGNSFPDNYQARMSGGTNGARDFGDERAEAINTGSAAIAAALRKGATVKQAADAGAASLGI